MSDTCTVNHAARGFAYGVAAVTASAVLYLAGVGVTGWLVARFVERGIDAAAGGEDE